MALFTLFCRRPTTKALFNFTARPVLSVAALRTESDTTGGAESSARAPKLGAAVAMLNNSKDREEEEKDMKIKRNFVGWTIRNAAHRPRVDFVFFRLPPRLRDSAVRQRTKSPFLTNPTYYFIDGTKLKLFTLPSNSSSTNHRFSTSFFPHALRSVATRASARIQRYSFFAFTPSPFAIISMILNPLRVKISPFQVHHFRHSNQRFTLTIKHLR